MSEITLINADCASYLKLVSDESIDCVITSPPYALQRKNAYGGVEAEKYPEWFEEIAKEIYRILKPTGSFVLNIKEHVNNGTKDTYVFKTVLRLSEIFMWNDTYIWSKTNPFPTGNKRRLKDGFEYCFFFTKTKQYKFFPDEVKVKSQSKWLESEKRRKNKGEHNTNNGSGMTMNTRFCSDMVRPSNVIAIPIDCENHKHPATFPVALPEFFIKLLTEPGDTVVDCFSGSGTTGVACRALDRNYIGIEINEEYDEIARERLGSA